MQKETLKAYTKLAAFLGHALGPDYEIALYDYVDHHFVLVALANAGISGHKLGEALSQAEMPISTESSFKDSNYIVHYNNRALSGKVLRASTLFLKNDQEQLEGLLSINFDDSHYTELSDRILELCHPHAFVETSFSYNNQYMEKSRAAVIEEINPESLEQQVEGLKASWGLEGASLGSREKLRIVKQLFLNGVFDRKGAVIQAAKILDCSLATMYRYLAQAKK